MLVINVSISGVFFSSVVFALTHDDRNLRHAMGCVPDVGLSIRCVILRYKADGVGGGRQCRAFRGVWRILFVGRWCPILCACDVATSGPIRIEAKMGFY